MRIVKDGWPLIIGGVLAGIVVGEFGYALDSRLAQWAGYALGGLLGAFMLYFFRDPERRPVGDDSLLMAGADGLVRAIEDLREEKYLQADTVRISIFLNPFNVHVNRAPMGGRVTALAYTPGRHLLTYSNAASEWNEHSAILIEGHGTRCLVKQIVGPIVRRVVYWLELDQSILRGERIGMMKFGSRLDMYFPKADVQVLVKKGDRVRAGETVVAQLIRKGLS